MVAQLRILALVASLQSISSFHGYFHHSSLYTASSTNSATERFPAAGTSFSLFSGIPDFSEEPTLPLNQISNQKLLNLNELDNTGNSDEENKKMYMNRQLMEPTFDDMKEMALILANITEHLDTNPELSLTVLSQKMGWLYSRDIPKLTQMLLTEFPVVRKDEGMMRAYMFLMDFLEAVVTETVTMQKTNQKALYVLLEAAKVSEERVDAAIAENKEQLTKQEFLLYLDAEIETQEVLVRVRVRVRVRV
jgi:hypothetical protein